MDSSAPDARTRTAGAEPDEPGPGGWPSVSNYWPDAPHRLGPAADPDPTVPLPPYGHVRDPFRLVRPLEPAAGPAAPPRDGGSAAGGPAPRRRLRPLLAGAAAVALLGGAGGALAVLVLDHTERPVITVPGPATPADAAPSAEPVPVLPPAPSTPPESAGRAKRMTIELVSSLATVTVRTRDLGDDLVRVRTPDGVKARLTRSDGRVRLLLTRGGEPVAAAAQVTLDDELRWTVRVGGGAAEGVLDLTRIAPVAVELAGGGARIDLRLPAANGVLPVRVIDGVNALRLRTPAEVPVRFRARAGAGKVDLYGRITRTGIARGDVIRTPPGGTAAGRIDVDATGGLGSLTVTRV